MTKPIEQLSDMVARFAADSDDGIQIKGAQFTLEVALLGNELATWPDLTAEIRAPTGTIPNRSRPR
jgi:hypothetical protein